MGIASRLKKQKYKRADYARRPLPFLARFLLAVLLIGTVGFAFTYSYWAYDWYGLSTGTYNTSKDPFSNVWNGQVNNFSIANPSSSSAVTGTFGFGSPSLGPSSGTDTGHLSFGSPVASGSGILTYVYAQSPQSYFINDSVQNAGPGSLFTWFGSSNPNQADGKLGVCYLATFTGSFVGLSFLVENPGGSAAGTIQGQLYSTTGQQPVAVGNPGCASQSTLLANSTSTVSMSSLGVALPSQVTFNFNSTAAHVVKGKEYIVIAHMTFTNALSASLRFEEMNGTWNGVSPQGPYCASTWSGGFILPNYAICNYSYVDNAGSSTQGPLNNPLNDNDQFNCVGISGCVWFNAAVNSGNSVALPAKASLSVSDSQGNSYALLGCSTGVNAMECAFDAFNRAAGTVAWVDVSSASSAYFSALAVSYSGVASFSGFSSANATCVKGCGAGPSITLSSPAEAVSLGGLVVGSWQVYMPDPTGFEASLLTAGTTRAQDLNSAGLGLQCDGYSPCGGNLVQEYSVSDLNSGSGKATLSATCRSGVGVCVNGAEELGLWLVAQSNSCPSGWKCFNSGADTGPGPQGNGHVGLFNGWFDLASNTKTVSVALSNDSYSLATAVGKPLSFNENFNGSVRPTPWAWYLTTNATLTADPNYNPLLDPSVYLAVVTYPHASAGSPTFNNGTSTMYVYMRHSADGFGLLAAGGGATDPFPVCSPNANIFICGRQVPGNGLLGGPFNLLLNFTGSTEAGSSFNNCIPNFSINEQPCGASYLCFNDDQIALGTTTCNTLGNFNTGQVAFALSVTGQINYTRIFPWLDIQTQKFHTGLWYGKTVVKNTLAFQVHKWSSVDGRCTTAGTAIDCMWNVFHVIFPNSGSCVLVSGTVPCNTQETGFVGWLGGLFNGAWNFVSGIGAGAFNAVVNPLLNFGNSLLSGLVSGIAQVFIYLSSSFQSLLNSLGSLWGDPTLGTQIFQFLSGSINTLVAIFNGLAIFQIWIFNFVFVTVPFLIGSFVTLVVSVSQAVWVIVIALVPIFIAFGGLINMPLQTMFFFDYVYGLFLVSFNGLAGFMGWLRFNIFLFTMGFQVFNWVITKILWTVRSIKQLLPVVG